MEFSQTWQFVQRKGERMLSLLGKQSAPYAKKVVSDYLLFVLLIFGVAFFSISFRTQAVSMGYKIGDLQQQKRDLENTHQCLKIEAASLKSLERIERIANEIGLTTQERVEVVFVPPRQSQFTKAELAQMPFLKRGYHLITQFFRDSGKSPQPQAEVIAKN